MQNSQSWILIRSAVLLAASAFLAPACGGSAEFTAAQAGAAGHSAGSSSGGSSNAGGSSGGAGNSGGGNDCPHSCPALACGPGFKSLYSPGDCCPSCVPDDSGGSGGGCSAGCVTIGCGPGFKSVQQPGQCCPSCVPDGGGGAGGGVNCEAVDCAVPECGAGYKYELTAGQCCGACVPDGDTCAEGQTEYKDLRSKLLADPSAVQCVLNTDCTLLSQNVQCGDQCAATPVSVQAAQSINPQLSEFAAANCAGCMVTAPPCAAPPPPICAGGKCILGGYL